MIIYTEGILPLDTGLNVFYRYWKAEDSRGHIIGIHGFAEHSGRYDEFARNLVSNGYSMVMYDLRGHGKTARGLEIGYVKNFNNYVEDTKSFIKKMNEKLNVSDFIIYGHSMGGLIVLEYISKYHEYLKGAITSGPATKMNASAGKKFLLTFMVKISSRSRIKMPLNPEELTHERKIWEEYIKDPLVFKNPTVNLIYEMYKESKSVWKDLGEIEIPILMLHGGSDRIVPKEATEKSFPLISSKDKTKKIYDGMFHEIHNEVDRKIVYDDIINWLKAH